MKPICPAVDQTRPPFTSVRTSITAVANSAVSMPIANATAIAVADEANTGEKRINSTPAPLITPAWSSADTGVGAASVDGSHRWIGTSADRAIPASTSSVATTVRALMPAICSPSSAAALVPTDRRSMSPTRTRVTTIATTSTLSPMRKLHPVRRCAATAGGHGAR